MEHPEIIAQVVQYIALPWCLWVTVSIFNQRQEIALLRQIVKLLQPGRTVGHEE